MSAPAPSVHALLEHDLADLALGEQAAVVAAVRNSRPVTREQIQQAGIDLLGPDTVGFSRAERLAVATFVSQLSGQSALGTLYSGALIGEDAVLAAAIDRAAEQASASGPFGDYPSSTALSAENTSGLRWQLPAGSEPAIDAHLAAALQHAHLLTLRPRESDPEQLSALARAGWDADAIVTLSQLVAYLSLQLRVVAGLAVLAGADAATPGVAPAPTQAPETEYLPSPELTGTRATNPPPVFTSAELDWVPWVTPVAEDALTDAQRDGLVDASRASNPYFRLLARDPQVLRARTLADKDIFYNVASGLPRAERELAAAATSRTNGCIYCASVHARFATHYSKRPADVQRLLGEGLAGEQEPRWRAIIDAAAALTRTPNQFGQPQLQALCAVGLDDLEISDVVHAAAFFNWANRLMLSLGEPDQQG